MNKWSVLIITALLATPASLAAWQDDAEGDASETVAGQELQHGRTGAADLLSMDIAEDDEFVTFTIAHAAVTSPYIIGMDQTEFTIHFARGELTYAAVVRFIHFVNTGEYDYHGVLWADGPHQDYVDELDVDGDGQQFVLKLPRHVLRDDQGSKPFAGQQLDSIFVEARKNDRFFCINSECPVRTAGAVDRMPDEGYAPPFEFQIGFEQVGDIRLESKAPMRWSNGGATTFVYEVAVTNLADESDTLSLHAMDVPAGWAVAQQASIDIAPGTTEIIPYAVQVGESHAHGQDETFLLEARGLQGIGRIELGVHFAEIPQPTGHHAQVYLHTREVDENFAFETIGAAAGYTVGAQAFMNTVDDFDGDEGIPVPGSKNGIGGDIDSALDGQVPTYGVVYSWMIPLSPGLRVGLDVLDDVNEGTINLDFDVALGTVDVSGRLAVIEDGEADFNLGFDTEAGTTLATLQAESTESVSGKMSIPVLLDGEPQTLPFAADQEMVLFIDAFVNRPDAPLTPNTGVFLTGGELLLPLAEYHDSIPPSVVLPEQDHQGAVEQIEPATVDSDESVDTPGFAWLGSLLVPALAAGRRR